MLRRLPLLLFCFVLCLTAARSSTGAEETQSPPLSAKAIEETLEGPFDTKDIAATSSWIQSTGVADWLGPLAPVALSPFFGIACLSGLAIWGPDWVTDNALLGSSGPLKNELLFFVFAGLTALTSLPRLTKVSKPFAQAVDRLETYAVIVILLIIKVTASMQSPGEGHLSEEHLGEEQVAMVQLGIVSFSIDTLLAIAMVINVLVINSVKFFFEFMVWLTPIPLVDAIFEACNKALCAALMAIYAFSPTLATVINLVILLVAAVVLRWISRRVRFYRSMVLDPILARLWTGFGQPKRPELIVFPKANFGPFAAKSRLRLTRSNGEASGWVLEEANWWMPAKQHVIAGAKKASVRYGWVMHSVVVEHERDEVILSFSRRYDHETLRRLLTQIGIECELHERVVNGKLASEFA